MHDMNINRKSQPSGRKGFILAAIILFLVFTQPVHAQMQEIDDSDLSRVYAQAGITYNWGDSQLLLNIQSIQLSDTDSDPQNWLEFNNVSLSGPGGYFTLDERDSGGDFTLYTFNTMDISTMTTIDGKERTLLTYVDATNTNPRTWSIGSLVFCDQPLGSIQFDMQNVQSTILNVSTHGEGYSGIEFEYLSDWVTESFSYAYNDSGDTLSLNGIHIAESASGDASDPSTWEFSGRFRIGDIYGGAIDVDDTEGNDDVSNPASMDMTTIDGTTYVVLNLPMEGTIRTEEVNFDDVDGAAFGPVAIDGITAHHLFVIFNPGE